MLEQDSNAREMEERQKVLGVIVPASDQPTRVVKPREEAFDLPAPLAAAERPAILAGRASTVVTMTRDHLDAVRRHQHLVERIAVVGFVADQALGKVGEEASFQGVGYERDFAR